MPTVVVNRENLFNAIGKKFSKKINLIKKFKLIYNPYSYL